MIHIDGTKTLNGMKMMRNPPTTILSLNQKMMVRSIKSHGKEVDAFFFFPPICGFSSFDTPQ